MDPVTAAKHVDSELPSLLPSLAIEGLPPPLQQSKYLLDANNYLMKYLERWQIISFHSCCLVGLSSANVSHPMDPVTAAKHVDSELPSLLPSLAIEGLPPPLQQSKYLLDANNYLMKYLERWQIISFHSCCLVGLSSANVSHPMDPVTAAKHVDSELPSLLPSLAIEGLPPPLQQSKYLLDANNFLMKYLERWQSISFHSCGLVGLSAASLLHPGVITVDRLVAIGIFYAFMFLLDDLFFDRPDNSLLDQYGIHHSARDSPEQMKECLDNLNATFSQQSEPAQSSPVEMMLWELGRDILRLSNPKWFSTFITAVTEHHRCSLVSHADIVSGHSFCFQDLESYSQMRAGNVGGRFVQLMTEFATNCYLPEEMRSLPVMLEATEAASMHLGFVNDIYSYHKESMQEGNPRNLITLLMEREGKTFVQAVHTAIGLTNLHAQTILDLELVSSNSAMLRYLQDIKELIVGNLYYSSSNKRYRQHDSVFPELRDVNVSG